MVETLEFRSINEIADTFSAIKIKKMTEHIYNKNNFILYRDELKEKGYILLRNLIPASKVTAAASVVDEYLIENSFMILQDGKEHLLKKQGILLSGFKPVTHHEKFLNVVEGTELKTLFNGIFGEESYTLETKWVRILGSKEYTDTHSSELFIEKDLYRFKKLGFPLYTCWIPLMDQGLKEGTLALCQDSFKLNYDEEMIEQQELPKGFLGKVLNIVDESTWLYNEYKIGDVVVFDIRMIHASFR